MRVALKIGSLLNVVGVLACLMCCTAAHGKTVTRVCAGASSCAQTCLDTDSQAGCATHSIALPPQHEADDCKCGGTGVCLRMVPERFRNEGGAKQPTMAPMPLHWACSTAVASSSIDFLPGWHGAGAAMHARLVCLRATQLRI